MPLDLNMLDPKQRAAVLDLDGPVIIHANPGAGKTRVIASRVALLLESRIPQDRILCFTFTNKAAQEMKDRIELYSDRKIDGLWIGTFHSICCRLLRQYGHHIGLSPDFAVCSDQDSKQIIKNIIHSQYARDRLQVSNVQMDISLRKQSLLGNDEWVSPNAMIDSLYVHRLETMHQQYQSELQKNNSLDFDDLIINTIRLFRDHPEILHEISSGFEYVLVDEYQDTSNCDAEIVHSLSSVNGNLCVVGDVKQSIYSFRGGNDRLMLDFEKTYQNARIHALNTNYRSCRQIVEVSERLIRHSAVAPALGVHAHKTSDGFVYFDRYESDTQEATAIATEIERLVSSGLAVYSNIAILFRLHAVSNTLKAILRENKLPFHVVSSLDDEDDAERILAILRATSDPHDDSVNDLRGMISCGISLFALFEKVIEFVLGPGYGKLSESLRHLWQKADEYPAPALRSLPEFLRYATDYIELKPDSIHLMSIHQSKGLEFPAVFVIGLDDNILPSWQSIGDREALEEERRLLYVAMTRASDRLYLSSCKTRHLNKNRSFELSRFISEIIDTTH